MVAWVEPVQFAVVPLLPEPLEMLQEPASIARASLKYRLAEPDVAQVRDRAVITVWRVMVECDIDRIAEFLRDDRDALRWRELRVVDAIAIVLEHLTPARKWVETERADPLLDIGAAGVQVGIHHVAAVFSHDFVNERAQNRKMLGRLPF